MKKNVLYGLVFGVVGAVVFGAVFAFVFFNILKSSAGSGAGIAVGAAFGVSFFLIGSGYAKRNADSGRSGGTEEARENADARNLTHADKAEE